MKISDRLSGLLLAVLGALAFWGGALLPPVPGQQVGPNVFPMVVGAGLIGCGILIMLHFGRVFEEEAEAEVAAHATAEDVSDAEYARQRRFLPLLPPALLVFYYLVSEQIGFIPTAILMILTAGFAFGADRRMLLPVSIGGAIFIHLVFFKLLRVPLPPGLLPMPW